MVAKRRAATTTKASTAKQPAAAVAVVLDGPYLRECRVALGLSQVAMARRIPVHGHTWGCWERGVYAVPTWQYTLILDALLEAKRERLERILLSGPTATIEQSK